MEKGSPAKKISFNTIKKSKIFIIIVLLLIISTSMISLINPHIYKYIIDDIIPSKNTKALLLPLCLMIIIPWIVTLLSSVKNYLISILSAKITGNLRIECLEKCLHAKQEALEKESSQQIIHRITRECGKIGEVYLTQDMVSFLTELVTLVSILITMFIYNRYLALICCIAFPVSFILTKFVAQRSKNVDKELTNHLEAGQIILSNIMRKIRLIKLKNGYMTEKLNWIKWIEKYRDIKQHSTVVHNINRFLVGDLIINLIYGILFFISGLMVINGILTIGELIIFISYIPKVYSSLRNVLNIKISKKVIENSFAKVDEILKLEQEQKGYKIISNIESIKLENVYFSYPRGDFNLTDFNMSINKGEKIGVVGSSGGGKSTIFDLITALYLPQKGQILINNTDIHGLNKDSLRNRIAVVTQNVELFDNTILYNIKYPNNDFSAEHLSSILHFVNLEQLINNLPEGINTTVGEDGNLLSGGERQRIAIANAILHDSDVILLDEFTSALDVATEKNIIDLLMTLSDKTIIMISHRIYNVMNCDKIYVINQGKILETGNPKELIKNIHSYFYAMNEKVTIKE